MWSGIREAKGTGGHVRGKGGIRGRDEEGGGGPDR